ncbi:TatD family hydrolase [Peptococcaceae bacterium 1198_IL3148]
MNFIDTHAHLNDQRFAADREQLINDAMKSGLTIINAGNDLETSSTALALAKKYPFIYATVGVHPHDAKDVPDDYLRQLKNLAADQRVVAIGEIGLDYYYDLSPRDVQRQVFVAQLNLAKELNLPVVIHLRDAYGDFLEIMRQEKLAPIGGVMHCYSGSMEVAQECLNMGFYISFAGPVTFKNAANLKEVAAQVPLEKILVETDSPYLTPVPHRGKRNQPDYVKYVAEQIAELKQMPVSELWPAIIANASALFKLPRGGEKIE